MSETLNLKTCTDEELEKKINDYKDMGCSKDMDCSCGVCTRYMELVKELSNRKKENNNE